VARVGPGLDRKGQAGGLEVRVARVDREEVRVVLQHPGPDDDLVVPREGPHAPTVAQFVAAVVLEVAAGLYGGVRGELEEDEASAERLAVALVRHPPLDGVVLRAPAAGQGAERRHGDEPRAGRPAGPRGGASPAEGQGRVHGPYLVRDASRA